MSFINIAVVDLDKMLQQGKVCLVDVRTQAEVVRGKIPQGEHMPLHLLPMLLGKLDRNITTVFYCQMGGRSAQAAAFAAQQGFVDVYNLKGGFAAWQLAQLPVMQD
jgi:rhodanese-related sulfurtransferase